jgi:hypothetical protein
MPARSDQQDWVTVILPPAGGKPSRRPGRPFPWLITDFGTTGTSSWDRARPSLLKGTALRR